jgi:hypothetical protein
VGKSQHHQTTEDDVFLNWTGLDHVANLTEIHLHALIYPQGVWVHDRLGGFHVIDGDGVPGAGIGALDVDQRA